MVDVLLRVTGDFISKVSLNFLLEITYYDRFAASHSIDAPISDLLARSSTLRCIFEFRQIKDILRRPFFTPWR